MSKFLDLSRNEIKMQVCYIKKQKHILNNNYLSRAEKKFYQRLLKH